MFRKKEETLDAVIAQLLRENGLETPLLQHRLLAAWPSVVGESIASRTVAERIYDQKLWVKIQTPALRTQLQMMRQQLLRQLNTSVGSQIIYDIAFY